MEYQTPIRYSRLPSTSVSISRRESPPPQWRSVSESEDHRRSPPLFPKHEQAVRKLAGSVQSSGCGVEQETVERIRRRSKSSICRCNSVVAAEDCVECCPEPSCYCCDTPCSPASRTPACLGKRLPCITPGRGILRNRKQRYNNDCCEVDSKCLINSRCSSICSTGSLCSKRSTGSNCSKCSAGGIWSNCPRVCSTFTKIKCFFRRMFSWLLVYLGLRTSCVANEEPVQRLGRCGKRCRIQSFSCCSELDSKCSKFSQIKSFIFRMLRWFIVSMFVIFFVSFSFLMWQPELIDQIQPYIDAVTPNNYGLQWKLEMIKLELFLRSLLWD